MVEDLKNDSGVENVQVSEVSLVTEENQSSGEKESTFDVKSNQRPFWIVGIGASAGGLEAMEQFFKHLPRSTGMAFVVIQHLDPHSKGMLQELIQRFTEMKVQTATDLLKVKINNVYIIPPNKNLAILDGSLHLFEPIAKHGIRLPIDYFFTSLADDRQKKSIGIILSGMGADGTIGLKAIKESGGLVLVQNLDSCKFDSMPRANAFKIYSRPDFEA